MEQSNVSLLLTIAAKVVFWVGYTFLQKPSSFKFLSILEENCVADIINETFKCKFFVDKLCKNCFWVSYTFLQKPSLFKHFWIWPSFSRNFFLFENQRFWRNQYLKVLMASKCDENKNWLSKTQKKSNVSLENDFHQKRADEILNGEIWFFFFTFFQTTSLVYTREDLTKNSIYKKSFFPCIFLKGFSL